MSKVQTRATGRGERVVDLDHLVTRLESLEVLHRQRDRVSHALGVRSAINQVLRDLAGQAQREVAIPCFCRGSLMSTVRATFVCLSKTRQGGDFSVGLSAVTSARGGNTDLTDHSPSGSVVMVISASKPAAALFEVGEEYACDFTRVGAS